MYKGKKVLVTGSSGFVGSRLVNELLKNHAEVIRLDLAEGFDITEWSQISTIPKFDIAFHLAARSYVPDSYQNPRNFYYTNVVGTVNILELCRLKNARMVFASSYVYGIPEYLPIDEQHPVKGVNPYAQSKIVCEKLCEGYNRDSGVSVVVIRPSNIYGPGQTRNFLIPTIINQIESGIINLRDSRPKRDLIFIDDVIEFYIKAGLYTDKSYDIFNCGSGNSFSIREIVDQILRLVTLKADVNYLESDRKIEIMDSQYNIAKSEKMLKWKPRISMENGLTKILENDFHPKTN